MNQSGDIYLAFSAARPFSWFFQGDSDMKPLLFTTYVRPASAAAALCVLALSGPAPAATAGSTPAENSPGLEEIIVTAEKRESTVQATPIAMTALSAGDLAEQNVGSIQDLIGAIPGISLRTAGPGQTEYEMRGLGSAGGSGGTGGFFNDEAPPLGAPA